MPMKWYVVHTYSGHENKAKLSLLDRVRQAGLMAKFGDILIQLDDEAGLLADAFQVSLSAAEGASGAARAAAR